MVKLFFAPFMVVKRLLISFIRWFRSTSRKKKIITVIAFSIVFFIIAGRIGSSTKPPPYIFAKAEKKDINDIVTESGNIIATNSIQVFSPTTGIIEEMMVSNGQRVTKGDELFSVVSSATEQEQQAAYATYLAAKTALDAAQASASTLRSEMYGKWKTYRDLATNDTYESGDGIANEKNREAVEFQMAQDNWAAAEAKYKNQQTAISQAQAQVNSAYQLYQATQNTTVKAPVSGVVANLSFVTGSSIKINTPAAPAVPVLVLANNSATEVLVALNEVDAISVRPGQKATVEVTAVNDKIYNGIVRRVDDIGTNDAGVIRYNAFIEVLQPDSRLKSGMTTDVTITTEELSNVLSVPNAAIKPYQGGKAVRIVHPKTKQMIFVPVRVGIKGEERTQILSGVTEGQEVITSLSNDQIKRPGLF